MLKNITINGQQAVLPQSFIEAVLKVKDFLYDLKENTDEKILIDFELKEQSAFNSLLEKWVNIYRNFEKEARELKEEYIDFSIAFARKEIHELVLVAPFVHRAFTKPRKYAGDYEMMNMLLRPKPMGSDNYAKLIHLLNIMPGIPSSVRNRNDIMLDFIQDNYNKSNHEKAFKILSVACGPAWEIERFLLTKPKGNIEIYLVDHDIEALNFAHQRLKNVAELFKLEVKIHIENVSVFTLIKEGRTDMFRFPTRSIDVVYSAGIMDYLKDEICSEMIAYLLKYVNQDGLFFTTNMHPNNPEKFWMNYIFDWNLIYRDHNQLVDLSPIKEVNVFSDLTGINLFMKIYGNQINIKEKVSPDSFLRRL